MDRLIDKINELHATIDYADYSELMDLAYELKADNERLNTNLNNFIEELAWRDVQLAAWESGMWNEACGQPSKSAISTYRKSYDKLYSECAVGENAKERAEKYLTAQSGKGEIMKNKENKLNGTEKQEPCMYCSDKEFMRKMQDLVQFTDENYSMELHYCPSCGRKLEELWTKIGGMSDVRSRSC